ncbi:DUF2975 domain-containing protein [Zunongwangia sp. F363]|uniref:DUF2975 domain-containing protein n=1 Tax=Autumnicola tepida TaxID=3075595 RepID=A0ABU3C9Y3_9FLAO|nr:DUF2975 domain-containing protein [Zunongwangia sp. F363]MDT0643136.1 DUF2975 domain-containing protein [Zunongwangia sp. F363]
MVDSTTSLIITLIHFLFNYSFMIYLVYLIRKLLRNLIQGPLFTRYQIAGFNLVGQLIIWYIVIDAIGEFVIKMLIESRMEFNISFPDFWLFIALGAFFMFLGRIFQSARTLKEENELTV